MGMPHGVYRAWLGVFCYQAKLKTVQNMKKIILAMVFCLVCVPSLAFASWWNPFSWFSKKNIPAKTETVNIATSTETIGQATSSAKKNKTVVTRHPITKKVQTKTETITSNSNKITQQKVEEQTKIDSTVKVTLDNSTADQIPKNKVVQEIRVLAEQETAQTIKQNQTCTNFTYSDWDVCSRNGVQSRAVLSASPSECIDGNPVLSKSCVYIPQCTSDIWSCNDWGSCSALGNQTRNCTKTFDCPFVDTPSAITSQSCNPHEATIAPTPVVIETSYSDYNFNYEWEYVSATDVTQLGNAKATLKCPTTSRNIQLKNATFQISPENVEKLQQMKV